MTATAPAFMPRVSSAALAPPYGPYLAGSVTENRPSVGVPLAAARCMTPQSALMKPSMQEIIAAIRRRLRE
ncbi:hypothetical protein [Rhodanobacter lindaniclasticus]